MASTPPPREEPTDLQLAAQAARLYYLADRSKIDIASELDVSRFKVARLLDLAKSAGLVTIQVRDPAGVDEWLSDELRDRLGLARAIVVDDAPNPRSQVGAAAARYLKDTIVPDSNVGLAWSRSTQALAEHVRRLPRCTIVQLCGVVAEASGEEHNVELVRRAARQAGVGAVTFYAPLVVSDAPVASSLRRQPGIAGALDRCGALATAVIAIGMWVPGESTVYDALPTEEQRLFARRGAVAETCGILFDKDGAPLADGLQDRTVAITIEQLRRTADVVALATDIERVPAMVALARSGIVSTLITHREVAHSILDAGAREESTHA
jgi:DNA-binding transcriptional regulator LsrR (DeoR family)